MDNLHICHEVLPTALFPRGSLAVALQPLPEHRLTVGGAAFAFVTARDDDLLHIPLGPTLAETAANIAEYINALSDNDLFSPLSTARSIGGIVLLELLSAADVDVITLWTNACGLLVFPF